MSNGWRYVVGNVEAVRDCLMVGFVEEEEGREDEQSAGEQR